MKIWFDTEFLENGRTIDLISIGMVREDGATFYAETPQAEGLAKSNDWLRANVLPQLRGWDGRERSQIADGIVAFAGEKPEFWAYYADYDWVALCQLYGTMMDLPKGWPMFCLDLKQKAHVIGNPRLPEQAKGEHNALDDALWAKHAWGFLCGLEACDREALENSKARLADATSNPASSDLSSLRKGAEELRRKLAGYAITEEYDFPGDAPEFCGFWCNECKEHVEADGSGHRDSCLCHGVRPQTARAALVSGSREEQS